MDSVLQSREVDPEEVLYNLGFADSEALAKIPRRFLQKPSVAKGVSIENFRKQQEEIFGRYETGFFGYRGLQGETRRLIRTLLSAGSAQHLFVSLISACFCPRRPAPAALRAGGQDIEDAAGA